MLLKITNFTEIDHRKLMDLYREGNLDNADYFYPDMDKALAIEKCEADFLHFLETRFFTREGSEYFILASEDNSVWISALRINKIEDGFYYLEALETHPAFRRQGYAACLLNSVIECLKQQGSSRLCDSVSKANEASIRTHLKCGFEIASETATDYLNQDTDDASYGMQYQYISRNPPGRTERRIQ